MSARRAKGKAKGPVAVMVELPRGPRRITKLQMTIAPFDPRAEPREPDFSYVQDGMNCGASWFLYLIHEAWGAGCDFEDLADGFGPGSGTMGGDWSGIRDSSPEAKRLMTQRALNFVREVFYRFPASAAEDFNRREQSS